MFRSIVVALLVAAVAAFAPAGRTVRSSTLMAFTSGPLKGLAGADGPESKNFDPLGLAEKAPEWVPWFREAEIKHGRIAMLAALGFAATDLGVRLPGDVHNVASAEAHAAAVSSGALIQVLLWTSLLEIVSINAVKELSNGDRKPGDFAFDPLGLSKDPKNRAKYEVNELKNGRLAMLAISGMLTQSVLTGHGFPYTY